MSCCNGNCGCGSSCSCGSGCTGCKRTDTLFSFEKSVQATIVFEPIRNMSGALVLEADNTCARCGCSPCSCT